MNLFLEICLFLLVLVGEVILLFMVGFTKRASENNADILLNQQKYYESEKGKNLATKEDIEDITKKVEEVKTTVSLSKQNEYDLKMEQERILLGILDDATKISICYVRLYVYLCDISSRTRLDSLVDSTNDILAHFRYLCNLATVSIPVEGIDEAIGALVDSVINKCFQISITATEAANLIDSHNTQLGLVKDSTLSNESKGLLIEGLARTKQKYDDIRSRDIPEQDSLLSAIRDFSAFLKDLYGKDLFLFKA